MYIYSTV